jgi:Na+-translocating ferredoxin:NAD+ oxidoreductase RNF subunit RnfB
MTIILITAVFALFLAFVLGTALGFFREFFAVPHDPIIDKIRSALPGANCGACGYPGCDSYAEAIAAKAPANACTVGGSAAAEKIAAITGVDSGQVIETVSVLACQGSLLHTPLKGAYTGIPTCRGAKIAGGIKLCSYGCMGFGDCVDVCKFGALSMTDNRIPKVDFAKCTGCGLCIGECPQSLFIAVPRSQKGAMALCSNKHQVKSAVVKACKIACMKCGACARNCPEHCIELKDNIPVVDLSKCSSCGTCTDKCPTKALKLIERDIFY